MKHSLLLSLLMFVCLGVFGQSSSVPPQKVTLDSIQSNIDSQKAIIGSQQSLINTLQDSIQSLQTHNKNLQMELINIREEVKILNNKYSWMNTNMALWVSILTIIMAILGIVLGVAAPLYFNYRNEKNMEKLLGDAKKEAIEARGKAESASEQAERAKAHLTEIQNKVEYAQGKVESVKKEVEQESNKSKALHYYVQASAESNLDKALDYYNRCIDLNPSFAEAYNNRGILKHRTGDLAGAMTDFTEAINHKREYAEAYNNRGIVYFVIGDMEKAQQDFNSAIEGGYADAYLNLGLLSYQKGNEEVAESAFDFAIKNKPDFAEALYIRGLFSYTCLFGEEDAIKDIIKAKEFKPNVVEAYPNRSLLIGKMKDLDNSFNGVEYSKDMTKLIRVPGDKKDPFIIIDKVIEIKKNAFWDCTSLTNIDISGSVEEIGDCAFSSCTSLTSIVIPDSVIKIGKEAFEGCTSLTTIEIPDSVIKIGNYAFIGCTNLRMIIVDTNNPMYCSEDGALYSKDLSQLIVVPEGKEAIIIPNSVTTIWKHAFFNNKINVIHFLHTQPIDFDLTLWGRRPEITLYVPQGSGEAYRNSGFYNGFKDIIEE